MNPRSTSYFNSINHDLCEIADYIEDLEQENDALKKALVTRTEERDGAAADAQAMRRESELARAECRDAMAYARSCEDKWWRRESSTEVERLKKELLKAEGKARGYKKIAQELANEVLRAGRDLEVAQGMIRTLLESKLEAPRQLPLFDSEGEVEQ